MNTTPPTPPLPDDWREQVASFVRRIFPLAETAALVIEPVPSEDICPVVIPLLDDHVPGCIPAERWFGYSANFGR